MKLIFISLLFVFFISAASGQKKKEIKKYKIKSVTEYVSGSDEGKEARSDQYEEYDKDGKLLKKFDYKKDGTLKKKETYSYDSYGNKTEEVIIDPKNNKNVKKSFKYNALKDKTEELEYKNGQLVSKTVFSYNANGNVIKEDVYDASGTLKKVITYTYNSKNLKETKTTSEPDGTVKSVRKYNYEFY